MTATVHHDYGPPEIDDVDEVQARRFMVPLGIFLALVFLIAMLVGIVRG